MAFKDKNAQYEYVKKFNRETYDDIKVRVPKGNREIYKAQALAHGYSLQAYIIHLLDQDAGRTEGVDSSPAADPEP